MNYPDFRKAPEGATHWDTYMELWTNSHGWWGGDGKFYEDSSQDEWGTARYIPIPVVHWDEAPEGYDYAYTTGPEWCASVQCLGGVEFADINGNQSSGDTLLLGPDTWVLLEKRPVRVEATIIKEYKTLEIFPESKLAPLRYKGYRGSIEINFLDDLLHGKILNKTGEDRLVYEAATVEGIKEAFMAAVDEYILSAEE